MAKLHPLQPRGTDRSLNDGRIMRGAVAKLGSNATPYGKSLPQRLDIPLTTASKGGGLSGPGERFDLSGTVLHMANATAATTIVEVQYNGQGAFVPWLRGQAYGGIAFDFVMIRWAASAESVTFIALNDTPDQEARVE